jgi:PKD repeat protein
MLFTNTSTGVYNSLLWTFGDGSSTTIGSPIRTYNAPGTYIVNLFISNNFGCIDTFKDTVVVLPNTLTATAVPAGPTQFCEGGSVIINAVPGSGYPAYNYLWSTTQATPSITAIYTGQYYVDVTDSKGCFVRSNSVNVLVKPQPKPNISGPIIVCDGDNPTFSVNYPATPYTINWSLDGAVTPWYNQSNYQIFLPSIGPHVLIVQITSPDTCIGYDTFNFTVVPKPNVGIIAGGSLCAGIPNLLVGTSTSTNILKYFWNTGSTNDSLTTSIAGSYSFTVVDSNGCKNSLVKTVYPLPDFCGLMTGCYDICDTVTMLVWDGPKGYASYQWLFNGLPIPGSIFDTLHVPLYQSGTYRLVITTAAGCIDTSDRIDINFIKCDSCIKIVRTVIDCGPLDNAGNQTYTVSMTIINNLSPGAAVAISSPQGSITGLTPVTLALGTNTVNFTFTDLPSIDTIACFNVVVYNLNTDCIASSCIKLPPCGGNCKDTIRWKSFDCKGFDAAGNPVYAICLNVFWGGNNGSTMTLSTPSGSFSPNPVTVNNGWQTICVNYTDLPPTTGFSTFYFTFYDTVTKLTCRDSLKRDYVQCKDSCRLAVVGLCAHCKYEGTTKIYTIELTINNTLGGPATVSIPPVNTGTIGTISPPIVPPGIGTVSFPFIDTGAKDSIVCFRIYLTVGNKICYQDVCVYLPDSCEKEHSGISNLGNYNYFMLAPNPAKESVQLSFSRSNAKDRVVQIKDINGRVIYQRDLKFGEEKLNVETEAWASGVYFVSLIQEGKYRGTIKLKIEK